MTSHTQLNEGHLHALDGREIPYVLEQPQGPERGAFLLLHGLAVDKNEYLGFYKRMSSFLTDSGFAVLRIDFPAHGDSRAPSDDFSLVNCIADATTAASVLVNARGTPRLNVFGTSFGAGPAVVVADLFRHTLGTLTLLAPALDYNALYIAPTHPQRVDKYRGFFEDALIRSQSVYVNERVTLNWRNAIEFAVASFDSRLFTVADRTAIIHGDADSMVPCELSRDLARRIPDIDLMVVPGMDHGFMDHADESGGSRISQDNLKLIFQKAIR